MKKLAALILVTATFFSAFASVPAMAAPQKITVTVDGKEIVFDQEPININDRVMVPIRFVAEAMGWDVDYTFIYGDTLVNGQYQKEYYAAMTKKLSDTDSSLRYNTNIWLGKNEINGWCAGGNLSFYNFDRPLIVDSTIINDRTLVGIRDIAEGLYADVDWVDATKTVVIKTKPVSEFPHYAEIVKASEEYKNGNSGNNTSNSNNNTQPPQPVVEEPKRNEEDYKETALKLANEERSSSGVGTLVFDEALNKTAEIRAEEIVKSFSHTRPNGESFRDAIYGVDGAYKKKSTSEIIACFTGTENNAQGAIAIWMGSTSGHRENLLNSKWKKMGVACKYIDETNYYVMIFSD